MIIKKITKILIVLIIVFTGSCQKYLEEDPTVFASPNEILVDANGAELYTVGNYAQIKVLASDFDGWLLMWGTIAADEIVIPNWGASSRSIYLHSFATSNIAIFNIWKNIYQSINRINSGIERISEMSSDQIDEDVKNKFIGEHKFLRAMLYFSLVSSWENVPLILEESNSDDIGNFEVFQSSTEDVYNLITNDLIFAEAVLNEEQGLGRATKGAAQALLGKVYLQMTGFPLYKTENYNLAANKLESVINSGIYDLLPYYPDVFSVEQEQSNEIIFSIGADGPGLNQGSNLGTLFGPQGQTISGGAAGNNWYINLELAGPDSGFGSTGNFNSARNYYSFAQSYTEDDIRSRNNVAKHNVNQCNCNAEDGMFSTIHRNQGNIAGWKPWKWHNINPSNWGSDTPLDQPYIRYADVLLMYAEALNGQDIFTQADADATINLIRERARVFPSEVKADSLLPSLVVGSQQYNADEILSERRKELCLEGWRRNDLIRFGRYYEGINSVQNTWSNSGNPQGQFSSHEIRWPIPFNEIQLNSNLIQNSGY
ncbi:MAG: RagB/SusD family nutrient uptake outer membrane protein [Parvicellaceae bacterium]